MLYLMQCKTISTMQLVALLLLQLSEGETTSCPHTTASRETKPLYLLTLVPFPDPRDGAGWDGGLGSISGARIARDEINNRTDLLPGYHIELIVKNIEACSLTETGIGLTNLARFALSPPCRPVLAVTGLMCSSHTFIVSPVAGHEGFDLMQLSIASSPIFQTANNSFPHLWRFLGSATAHVSTAMAIMDQFKWKRIGLVYDVGSVFHTEVAAYFEQQVKASANKTIVFKVAVIGTWSFYFDGILSNLRNEDVTILFVSLNSQQTSILLNRTYDEGFTYPEYTWLIVESTLKFIVNENVIERVKVHKASHGYMYLIGQTKLHNESEILASREPYTTFIDKFNVDFEVVQTIYHGYGKVRPSVTYASYLYDEVWALALAVNNSLPVLEQRKLSIDNYTIGQPEITKVLEEEMAKLSFQGAGGFVEFDQYHGVITPAEVIWVSDNNGTEEIVGIYNPKDSSDFHIRINSSDLPEDRLRKTHVLVVIPFPVAILLYILAGAVIIFTTVQIFFYLNYRNHKVIKATSPYLSLLMFAGCYLFCLAAIVNVTYGSFIEDSPKVYNALLGIEIVTLVNGFSLILVTLFIRLLRVHRIFFSRLKMDLGNCWSNLPLFLIIIALCILPNIITVPVIIFEHPVYHSYNLAHKDQSIMLIEKHIRPQASGNFVTIVIVLVFFMLFLILICFLAVRARKIRYSNFKDTKKINLFIAILIFTISLSLPLYFILLTQKNEPAANIVLTIGTLILPMASQLILFLPKVLPAVVDKHFPGALGHSNTFLSPSQQKFFRFV